MVVPLFLAMVIVGGLASVWGAIAGAIVLEIVETQSTAYQGWSDAIIGGVVVLMLLLLPDGLAALPRRLARLAGRRAPAVEPLRGET